MARDIENQPGAENKENNIVKEARELYDESQTGSFYNREESEEDIRFARLGQQWPDSVKRQREAEGRPVLTINKLPAFVRQVVNDARQNRPAIKVSPVDNGSDPDTADVINGLIRSIERRSRADVAYSTALDHAVSGGFGFCRIVSDYVSDRSFDMEPRIERIPNPLMVHWDVDSLAFDASDWEYAFVADYIRHREFQDRYPGKNVVDFEGDRRIWMEQFEDSDKVLVAEYWRKELTKSKIYLLSDGNVLTKKELNKAAKDLIDQVGGSSEGLSGDELITEYLEIMRQIQGPNFTIENERDTEINKVTRRVISGVDVLEEDQWHGQTIPICPVWGEEVMIDGRRHFRSMVRDVKDSQMNFNFWRSASTELVALAPRAPWVGPTGFVPPHMEEDWKTANTRSHSHLEYDGPVAPQRQPFAGVPAGALTEAANSVDDIKSVIGIYDASLGAQSNEVSGRAILARQRESDVSNFHFVDNLSRAIQYAGRCLVDIIPYVYSSQSAVRILGEDQGEKVVKLSQGERRDESGEKMFNLTVGTYDVTVASGPSYSTQRQESREILIEIMRSTPDAAPYMFDMVLELLDFQGADKAAKRARMMLPPNIQQAESEESVGDMPEEVQQAMQMAKQQIQQLQQQLQQVQTEQIPEKEKAELENKKLEADIALKHLELQLKGRDLAISERGMNLKEMEAQKNAEMEVMRMLETPNEEKEELEYDRSE